MIKHVFFLYLREISTINLDRFLAGIYVVCLIYENAVLHYNSLCVNSYLT